MKYCLRCGKEFSEGDFCSECGGRLNEQVTTNCAAEEHTVKVYFKKGEGSPFDDDLCRNGTLFAVNADSAVESDIEDDCVQRFIKEVGSEIEADYVVTKDNYEEFIEEYCYGHRDLTMAERKKFYNSINHSSPELFRYGAVINVSVFDLRDKSVFNDWCVIICDPDDPAGNVDDDTIQWCAASTDDFLKIFIAEGSNLDSVVQILDVLDFQYNIFPEEEEEDDDEDWDEDDDEEDEDEDEFDFDSDDDEDEDDSESNEVAPPATAAPGVQPTSSFNTQIPGMDSLNSQLNDMQSKLDQQMREMQEKLDQMLKNK